MVQKTRDNKGKVQQLESDLKAIRQKIIELSEKESDVWIKRNKAIENADFSSCKRFEEEHRGLQLQSKKLEDDEYQLKYEYGLTKEKAAFVEGQYKSALKRVDALKERKEQLLAEHKQELEEMNNEIATNNWNLEQLESELADLQGEA